MIAALIPVLFNAAFTLRLHSFQPELVGIGSSVGLLLGFATLFVMAHLHRKGWMAES